MPASIPPARLPASVHVIGAGLIGTSIAMVLARAGVRVTLADGSPTGAALAADLSGGVVAEPGEVDLVVVATPPDVAGGVVAVALDRWPRAFVTDVASVKRAVRADVLAANPTAAERYVGGHPMSGRERSGAIAARIDLFEGRTWVITRAEETSDAGVGLVRGVAEAAGSVVHVLSPAEHDQAVAAVSHVPQVAASLVAARLADLTEESVALAGPGVRDVTRIAASDPRLWTQILTGNAPAVAGVLRELALDLGRVVDALDALTDPDALAPGARATIAGAIAAGNRGHDRLPGKHGAPQTAYRIVTVLIPDEPGQLGRLFQDVGDAGVNLEELNLEHGLGAPFGLLELSIVPEAETTLIAALTARGWRLHT